MSDGVYMDPAALRRVAEQLLGDREFDYRPKLDEIKRQLRAGGHSDTDAALHDGSAGYLYGRSGIGAFHDQVVKEIIDLFEGIDLGYIAMSNAFASIAEEYVKTDGDAGTDMSNTMPVFSRGNPAPVEVIDPGTGIIRLESPYNNPAGS